MLYANCCVWRLAEYSSFSTSACGLLHEQDLLLEQDLTCHQLDGRAAELSAGLSVDSVPGGLQLLLVRKLQLPQTKPHASLIHDAAALAGMATRSNR